MTVTRRFIAGARCPQCGELDRVQRCSDGDRLWMECVACGMQKAPDEPEPDPGRGADIYRGGSE